MAQHPSKQSAFFPDPGKLWTTSEIKVQLKIWYICKLIIMCNLQVLMDHIPQNWEYNDRSFYLELVAPMGGSIHGVYVFME